MMTTYANLPATLTGANIASLFVYGSEFAKGSNWNDWNY